SLSGVTSFRPSTLRWPQAGIVPISHTRDTAGPMARNVADCLLLDGVITDGATEVAPARLSGLRLGVPRGHFWENLDAELGEILAAARSEEHTSELQSRSDLVCRLLLEKKKKIFDSGGID